VGHVHALTPATPKEPHKTFKRYEPGYVHMDIKYLPQMADETRRRYLFVAIDRATRWVYVAINHDKTAASARSFLQALHTACPVHIVKLLTDNGKECTDRLVASRERQPSGHHEFDWLCQELGIEHRLTKPRTPHTNGMVERFNGRIAQVLATRRYRSADDLGTTLLRYAWLYHHHLPQKALGHRCPMEAMKQWYTDKPDLFTKQPRNLPGPDM
jgi:transposase InsO family protein